MELHSISFYEDFACVGSKCSDTCCKGWRIPVDIDALHKYDNENGLLGLRLRKEIQKDGDLYVFNKNGGICPFLTNDKLCSLQCKKGPEFMPNVCRRYPRRILNYGAFVETSLELACPTVAMLFLKAQNPCNMVLSSISDEDVPERFGTNDDFGFLKQLLSSREALIKLTLDLSLSQKDFTGKVLNYGRMAQSACISGDFSFFEKDFTQILVNSKHFSFDGKARDLMITSGLYHTRLKKKNPNLYKLCKLYYKTYDNLSSEEADKHFYTRLDALLTAYPELNLLFRNYYSYFLQSSYLEVFEHYSFFKTLTEGFVHLTLLQLFFTLYYDAHGTLSLEDRAMIISSYEKRGRHNFEIQDNIYTAIYDFLP